MFINQVEFGRNLDLKIWLLDANLQFSVRSLYVFLNLGGILSMIACIWSISAPLKARIVIWSAAHGKLNSSDVLWRKGIQHNRVCTLCNTQEASVSHLFLTCSFTLFVWNESMRELGVHSDAGQKWEER